MKKNLLTRTPREVLDWTARAGAPLGTAILQEVPDPHRFYLWEVYRLTANWVISSQNEDLLDTNRVEALLRDIQHYSRYASPLNPGPALTLLLCELLDPKPDRTEMGLAAMAVCEWALEHRYVECALAYLGLAAGATDSPRYAWVCGRMHRAHGNQRDAEHWLEIAHGMATRRNDHETEVKSLLSYGHLHFDAGRYPHAKSEFSRAVRVAERRKLTRQLGESHHDLFAVAVAMHDHALAAREVPLVLTAYGPEHPRLPYFTHDLATYWMDRGEYPKALRVLLTLVERGSLTEPESLLLLMGSALRAAGGAGHEDTFDRLFARFQSDRMKVTASARLAQGLLGACRGAASLSRWIQAEALATEAASCARDLGQNDIVILCNTILTDVHDRATPPRASLS